MTEQVRFPAIVLAR